MTVQIQLFNEYRDLQGNLDCEPADDPFLMDLDEWEVEDKDHDRVGQAVFELLRDGVTCFDGPTTAHSSDWIKSEVRADAEYRGRVRMVGFTATELEQIKQQVEEQRG